MFIRFDHAACGFPSPRLSLLPKTSKIRSGANLGGRWKTIIDGHDAVYFSRGRYALLEAYRRAIDRDGAILLPAYHCRTMVDPALSLRLRVHFYSVSENLMPCREALEALLSVERAKSASSRLLIVLPDYFGFPQQLEEVRALCDFYGAELIRDRSHALCSLADEMIGILPTETLVASPYKFVGSEDGGSLIMQAKSTSSSVLQGQGWRAEMRGWVHLIRNKIKTLIPHGVLDPELLSDELATLFSKHAAKGVSLKEFVNKPSSQFVETAERQRSLAASRWLLSLADLDDLAEKRRRNFRLWVDAAAKIPHCRVLFPDVPDNCVPYMFPLYLEAPDTHFYLLKQLGVPVGRWDEIAVSDCPMAAKYRLGLIHLPCHQDLNLADMKWLIAALDTVLSISPKGAA